MNTKAGVGSVEGLWLFPVKSMGGKRLERATVTPGGLVGDRAYALIDVETGKVASAKSVRLFPGLLACGADFVDSPHLDQELPPVRITLPGGKSVDSDSNGIDAELSAFFGRDVTLVRSAPRGTVVEQGLGSAFFEQAEIPSPVPPGSFFDLYPLSLLTQSTLARLRQLRPSSDFDERRFRMNLIVGAGRAGFVENEWIGHQLAIGDSLRITVARPDARCVMTTLAQDDLPRDTAVLRTLVEHNRLPLREEGKFPCAGVYAEVAAGGSVQLGDSVSLL